MAFRKSPAQRPFPVRQTELLGIKLRHVALVSSRLIALGPVGAPPPVAWDEADQTATAPIRQATLAFVCCPCDRSHGPKISRHRRGPAPIRSDGLARQRCARITQAGPSRLLSPWGAPVRWRGRAAGVMRHAAHTLMDECDGSQAARRKSCYRRGLGVSGGVFVATRRRKTHPNRPAVTILLRRVTFMQQRFRKGACHDCWPHPE